MPLDRPQFRPTFAIQLVMAGLPLKVVQAELFGHATTEMTTRYAHLAPGMHVEAVAKIDRHCLGTDAKIRSSS